MFRRTKKPNTNDIASAQQSLKKSNGLHYIDNENFAGLLLLYKRYDKMIISSREEDFMAIEYYSNQDFIENGIIQASFRDGNLNCPLHRHQYYELEIFLSGEGTYCLDDHMYPIRRGELFLMSPISFHDIRCSLPGQLINVIFALEMCDVDVLLGVFGVDSHINCRLSDEELEFIGVLVKELMAQIDSKYTVHEVMTSDYIRVLLNCILAKVKAVVGGTHNTNKILPIQHAMLYVQNHFGDPLTLENVSKIAGYSPNYFNYKFKEYTGVSFKQYLSDLRFTVARRMLETTNVSVEEIGAECGFRNASNFSLGFKKKYGTSPLHYRERKKQITKNNYDY